MGIKQENEITMKVNCEIKELCRILEDKGFKVIDKFTMNDIFMIPNTLKTKIKDLTSREILRDAILIKDIENGENLIEVETVADNDNIATIEKLKTQIINLQIPVDTSNFFVKKAEIQDKDMKKFF